MSHLKYYKKLFFYILIAFCLLLSACSKSEDRAVWVVRFDLKTEDNVKKIVKNSKNAGFNTIIAQIYGRGDSYYNSMIAPRAEILEDQPLDYDPLEVMVKECRDEGLKVHAWVNVFYIWYGVSRDDPETYPKSGKHIVHTHPEWIIKDSTGKRVDEYDKTDRKLNWIEGLYADPSNVEYRRHFISICMEIAQKYDIDGLHLDFVRYPGSSFGYNDKAVNDFKDSYGVDPFDLSVSFASPVPEQFISKELPLTARWEYYYHSLWIEHKSEYVTSLVKELREILDEMSENGRKLELSAAVFPDKNSAYFSKSQDWGRWLDEGYLDMIMPMSYDGSKERVLNQIYNVKKTAGDKKVLAGLGSYTKSDGALKDEVRMLQKFNIDGFSFFSYGGMIKKDVSAKKYTPIKSVRKKMFTPRARVSAKKKNLKTPPQFKPVDYIYKSPSDRHGSKAALSKTPGAEDENVYNKLLDIAKSKDLTADPKEVEKFLACLKKQFYSEAEFYSYLRHAKIDEEKLKKGLADDIIVFKSITEKIYPGIAIKNEEVITLPPGADYQMIYRRVHPKDSMEKRRAEKKIIDKVYKKLKSGGDFAELAKEYSRSVTAGGGGYYKNKYFDELDDLCNIIFSLNEEEITKVVTRPSGYAIYKLNEFKPEARMVYENVSNDVKKVIFYNRLKKGIAKAFGETK